MENIPFDVLNLAAWEQWTATQRGTNHIRLERLRRNLPMALETLTPRQRQMVELYFYENLSVTEIAQRLGINKSSSSRALARARKSLRNALRFSL